MTKCTGKILALAALAAILANYPPHAWSEQPRRVLIIGDSMMRVTAHALELSLARQTGIVTRAYTSLGSGLARLDVFDWLEKSRELQAEFDPDYTFAWFGTNDRQPMLCDGRVVQPTQPEWETEYARRIGVVMDLLTRRPGARVFWLELPDMRDAAMQADVAIINRLVEAQAGQRPAVSFLPTRLVLSRAPGKFSQYVIGDNGLPLPVRDPDGIHLNRAGADRLAVYMTEQLGAAP